jgi:GNAT superfamily N-acetyltransferase
MVMPLPDGLVVTAAALTDFNAVLSLMMSHSLADYGEPMISAEGLRGVWAELDLAREAWVVRAPEGELAGYAHAHPHPPARFAIAVFVAEKFRGRGLGTYLLTLAEARAQSAAPAEGPLQFSARLSERNPTSLHVFEKAGYHRRLSFFVMEQVLVAPPPPAQWPVDLHVRPFLPGQDDHPTYLADEESAVDKGYHAPMLFAEWAERMGRYSENFDPSLWFLACADQQVVGVALNTYSPATKTIWVDHLGVRAAWRRRGVGRALLLHSFGAFYQRGLTHVRLSVDSHSLTGAPRLYESVGMRIAQQYHIYRKEWPPAPL